MDFESMEASPGSEPVLAQWHCDAGLWRQFKDSERFDVGVRSARNLMIGSVVVTAIVLVLVPLIWFQGYGRVAAKLQVAFVAAAVVVPGVFMLTGLILWLTRRSRAAAMNTETGEVIVRLDGYSINGLRSDWGFGGREVPIEVGVTPWRLQNCQRKTVAGRLGTNLEVIEFQCEGTTRHRGVLSYTSVDCRVPVPLDRIADADRVVERLNLRSRSAKQELAEVNSNG